jgi:diphthamide synthase (EF-2-diphthine--ammonia ligase)
VRSKFYPGLTFSSNASSPNLHPADGAGGRERDGSSARIDAVITSVDPLQRSPAFLGRDHDAALLAALPPSVDRCGERGEFHTFCYGGPIFAEMLAVRAGERCVRDSIQFVDVVCWE